MPDERSPYISGTDWYVMKKTGIPPELLGASRAAGRRVPHGPEYASAWAGAGADDAESIFRWRARFEAMVGAGHVDVTPAQSAKAWELARAQRAKPWTVDERRALWGTARDL
jgi:hypothetical protein